jgi:hypothetical protein
VINASEFWDFAVLFNSIINDKRLLQTDIRQSKQGPKGICYFRLAEAVGISQNPLTFHNYGGGGDHIIFGK